MGRQKIRVLLIPKAGKAKIVRRMVDEMGSVRISKGHSFIVDRENTIPYKRSSLCCYLEGEPKALPITRIRNESDSIPTSSQIDEIGVNNLIQQLHGAMLANKVAALAPWILLAVLGLIIVMNIWLGNQIGDLKDAVGEILKRFPQQPQPTGGLN